MSHQTDDAEQQVPSGACEGDLKQMAETLILTAKVQPDAKTAKAEMLEFLTNNNVGEMTYKDTCFQAVETRESVKARDAIRMVLIEDFEFDDEQVQDFENRVKAKKREIKESLPVKCVLRIKKPKGKKTNKRKSPTEKTPEEPDVANGSNKKRAVGPLRSTITPGHPESEDEKENEPNRHEPNVARSQHDNYGEIEPPKPMNAELLRIIQHN